MCDLQVELYNHIVEEGTDGEAAAKKAYIEAREEIDHDSEKEAGDKVASALINRVRITFVDFCCYTLWLPPLIVIGPVHWTLLYFFHP